MSSTNVSILPNSHIFISDSERGEMEITNSSHDIISINIKMRNKEKGLLFVTPSKKTLQPKSTQIIKIAPGKIKPKDGQEIKILIEISDNTGKVIMKVMRYIKYESSESNNIFKSDHTSSSISTDSSICSTQDITSKFYKDSELYGYRSIGSILLVPLIVSCLVIYFLELISNFPIIGFLFNPIVIYCIGWLTSYSQYFIFKNSEEMNKIFHFNDKLKSIKSILNENK